MKVLIEGDFKTVQNIMQESKLLVARGLVKFTDLTDAALDEKKVFVSDTKEPQAVDNKSTQKPKGRK